MKKLIIPIVLLFCLISCNKDFGNYFDQEIDAFPPRNIENVTTIAQEDDLYSYLNLVAQVKQDTITEVGCIEFIYPFVLFRFDENDTYVNQVSVLGNQNFTSILNELQDGYSIGLSYPISGNLIDGTPVTVNSNDELLQSLETCIEEELEIIIGGCNAIVQDCIWKITESNPEDSPYIESFFTLREDGSVVFSVLQPEEAVETEEGEEENPEEQNPEYERETGTWIFYFIGADLHMNINFGPVEEDENGMAVAQDSVKLEWNFDWKINYIDLEKIELEKSYTEIISTEDGEQEEVLTALFTLEKECEEEESAQQ